jgi:nucleoside 2-deoxyribosyltransferase
MVTEKTKVYLCARISPDAHAWNNTVCDVLDDRIAIFKPQEHNPSNMNHRNFQPAVYETDVNAMRNSDIGLLLIPYGRDCAWEVGWFSSSGKPVVAYVESGTEWLRDWMIKGGLDVVITVNKAVYEILKQDPMLKDKCLLIESRRQLGDILAIISQIKRGNGNG